MKPGSVLDGKYELRRRIGDGAMGVVWEGLNQRTEREVAVKVLLSSGRDEDRQRLLREARAGGRIRHPNVLDVYDVAETDTGSPFIVMELLRGETLGHRLARETITLEESLRILRDVARGLGAAHKVGVVHRDLKPQNIYLHNEPDSTVPTVKLVEFGISRIDAEATLTLNGVTLGSPGYVAPEQIDGRNVDKRADIWAFGALAFELFTGEPLFGGGTPAEIVQKVGAGPIPELPRIAHEVDVDLRALTSGCLVRNIDKRFQTIEECGVIIERLQKRVSHPTMAALAELRPTRVQEREEDEPTTVNHRSGASTQRMPARMQSEPEEPVTKLTYKRAPALSDPDTITDVKDRLPDLSTDFQGPGAATAILPMLEGVDGPRTIIDPPKLDDASLELPRSQPPPPVISSRPPPSARPPSSRPPSSADPSQPPPFDAGTLSTRAVQMFRADGSPEKDAEATQERSRRVSLIALVILTALVVSIGLAVIVRQISAPAKTASRGDPSAAPAGAETGTATASSEVTAPATADATAEATAIPDATATPTSTATATPTSTATATTEASAKGKTPPPHVGTTPPVHRPTPPPSNDGTFNPTSL